MKPSRPDWLAVLPHNPRSREGLAPGDLQQCRFPRIVERMAILDMERARQADEHFAVGLASRLEFNAHRLTSETALIAFPHLHHPQPRTKR
jgi:hypothetical protein